MKKELLLILLFFSCHNAFCQMNIQHYQGIMGAEISVHQTPIGTNLKVGYSKYLSNNIYYKISGGYGAGRKNQVLLRNWILDGAIYYSPFNLNGLVFINVAAGPIVTYERMKNFVPTQSAILNYGGKAGIELEVPIYDGLLLIGNGYQEFFAKKAFGQKRNEFGIGVKILIN